MSESIATSINVSQLAAWIAEGRHLKVLDVRRAPAFEKNPCLIPGAERVPPDQVDEWSRRNNNAITVIAYCVYGHEVSQGAASALKVKGFDVVFLEGGISEWQSQGHPTAASDGKPFV